MANRAYLLVSSAIRDITERRQTESCWSKTPSRCASWVVNCSKAMDTPAGSSQQRGSHTGCGAIPRNHPPATYRRGDAGNERTGTRRAYGAHLSGHQGAIHVPLHGRRHRASGSAGFRHRAAAEAIHQFSYKVREVLESNKTHPPSGALPAASRPGD
jgi:hypothetical protein